MPEETDKRMTTLSLRHFVSQIPDNRASLPVYRVRMDAAYTRIGAVICRVNLTIGHGVLFPRRGGFPLRRLSARMGAKPGAECGWRVARWRPFHCACLKSTC